jgi:hypothetical protein
MVQLLMGYLGGIDYANARSCKLCWSLTERYGVFHFLCLCTNDELGQLRSEMYGIIRAEINNMWLSHHEILDICLSGQFGNDKTKCTVAGLVNNMHKKRLLVLKQRM